MSRAENILQILSHLVCKFDENGERKESFYSLKGIQEAFGMEEEEIINIAKGGGYYVYKIIIDEDTYDIVASLEKDLDDEIVQSYVDFFYTTPQIEEYYNRRWQPSKTAKREFAKKMSEVEQFCYDNNISNSSTSDSYYFTIDGQKYRVSNHSVESSYVNSGGKYHNDGREDDTIYIHASKTRIMDIYNALKQGKKLDGRGNIINEANLKNELRDRARLHKRSDKKGAKGWFVNPDAGNVEYNVAFFNHAMGSDLSSSGNGESVSMGESVNEGGVSFLNRRHKNRVIELLNEYKDREIKMVLRGNILCHQGAISNLFFFHNLNKDVTLYFGNLLTESDDKGKFKEISHSWIVYNGKEYHTNFPQNTNVECNPLITINIPKELSNEEIVKLVSDELNRDLQEAIEKHETLNPKLWDENQELIPIIKERIELIVDKFVNNLIEDGIDIEVKDIIIIGSNANYNYTKDSDLDIHIITSSEIAKDNRELLKIIYNAYKTLFNRKYEIRLRGINVELYVEEGKTNANSSGIYSLSKGWINKPTYDNISDVNIDREFKEWESDYNELLQSELTSENVEEFIYKLYELRQNGIQDSGEYSKGNLIFKEFRNLGYLDNLKSLYDKLESRKLSLENINIKKELKNGRLSKHKGK